MSKNVNTKTKGGRARKIKLSALALAGAGFIGFAGLSGATFANRNSEEGGLASRLAIKFGLNRDEVSAEIDAYYKEKHSVREAEMKAKLSEYLQKKVDEGKLTSDQKTALEAKLGELHDKYKEAREHKEGSDLSLEERKAQREAEREELEAWAEQQGINLDEVLPNHNNKHFDNDSRKTMR